MPTASLPDLETAPDWAGARNRESREIRELCRGEPDYPAALLDLPHPPDPLFAWGDLGVLSAPCVAIVGTRRSTAYGDRVTRALATVLARAGACVVSGMARGVDAMAHRAALECRGRTAAVLGTGVDIPYPVAHRALHETIAREGVLLSEFPPGRAAGPGSFPRRNRIIAGLAKVTIVVEAGAKSGALITAVHALELGRTVAAVPGPIDAPQSVGSNELLRDGASIIAAPEDALMLMGLSAPRAPREDDLPEGARRVLEVLASGGADIETIATRAGLPLRECLAAVTALELAGRAECALTGEIRRR